VNVSFSGVGGEALIAALTDLAVSSGSACNSAVMKPSHVLLGIGANRSRADSAIRFSLGRQTTEEQVSHAVGVVARAVALLRGKSLD